MVEIGQVGHRKRLRERLLVGDVESLSDERLLELLLTFTILRKDVKPLAQKLIQTFGGLSQVLAASPDKLAKVKGMEKSSIALLQAVNYIRLNIDLNEQNITIQTKTSTQPPLFESVNSGRTLEKDANLQPIQDYESNVSLIPNNRVERANDHLGDSVLEDGSREAILLTQPSKRISTVEKLNRRKFQVSNGYLLEFDQLARVLHFLLEHKEAKIINRKIIQDDTGLSERQIENLVSMGSAMGLIKPTSQVLTPTGLLFAEHDIFLEKKGTLEWCHYVGASSYRNLVWFEIFNHLLQEPLAMTPNEWHERLRTELAGKLTPKTLGTGLREEIRFILDAYLERNFNKLGLLQQSPDGRIYRRRYTNFIPLVLCAMIYDYCSINDDRLSQVTEIAIKPGSPAVVFGLDTASFRQQVELLHEHGWLRYETTHNLDQIRLKPGYSALEFLSAYFEDREPY